MYVTQALTSDATRRYSHKVRIHLRNGEMLTLTTLFQCETIVEDNEDVFTSVLSKENPNPVDEICVDQTNLCSQALRDEL